MLVVHLNNYPHECDLQSCVDRNSFACFADELLLVVTKSRALDAQNISSEVCHTVNFALIVRCADAHHLTSVNLQDLNRGLGDWKSVEISHAHFHIATL